MKYTILLMLFFVLACKQEKLPPVNEPGLQHLMERYRLRQAKSQIATVKNLLFAEKISYDVKNDLDFNNLESFVTEQGNTWIYIIGFRTSKDKKYAIRVIMDEGLRVVDEVLYSRKITDAQDGTIEIHKNGEAMQIQFVKGIRTINEMEQQKYLVESAGGFCQRQENQKFKDCYNHEVDEFCDSFISCIALATNPSVSILIGIACSCYAS